MAAVRSKGNRTTEVALRMRLVAAGLSGWRVNADEMYGRCDFVFDRARLAIFVDGCQWHGCPRCYRAPTSNAAYWRDKLERNRRRDEDVTTVLRNSGWTVMRVWEHELRERPKAVLSRIRTYVSDITPVDGLRSRAGKS